MIAGAGAGVYATQQVNMKFTSNLNKENFEAGYTDTTNGKLDNHFMNISSKTDDNFDSLNESIDNTSKTLTDLTVVNPEINDSSFVKERREKEKLTGAQRQTRKREAERKEREANETGEETIKRKFVEKGYSVRNKSYAQAAKAAGGKMLEI